MYFSPTGIDRSGNTEIDQYGLSASQLRNCSASQLRSFSDRLNLSSRNTEIDLLSEFLQTRQSIAILKTCKSVLY